MSITINLRSALASLTRLANHPLAGWMQSVAKREHAKVERRIMTGKKDPDGQRWAPWSDHTKEHRKKKGTVARGLLFDEGLLVSTLITQSDNTHVIIGATTEYAEYLQAGTPNMPARPYLGWDDVSLAKYEIEAARYLERLV